MTHASLFSGIGGFDLAAEWMGWQNVFNCEIDPFCRKVLAYHFPDAKQYEDVKTTDFTIHRGHIDVLTGGFPCQPFSLAGKRKGANDDRYLWPEMLRAIREIQPRWVVGENVLGIVNWSNGMVFEQVQADLEAAGYEVQPFLIPACAVDAPHRRDRVWFVAYRRDVENAVGDGFKREPCNGQTESGKREQRMPCTGDSERMGGKERAIAYTTLNRDRTPREDKSSESKGWSDDGVAQERRESPKWDSRLPDVGRVTADSRCDRSRSRAEEIQSQKPKREGLNTYGHKDFGECFSKFPTQSPVCSGDDGLSDRLDSITFPAWRRESIKAYGNAVVPQIPYLIFQTIEQYTNL